MKYVKTFTKYRESVSFDSKYQEFNDIMESLNIWHDALLGSINADKVDMYETLVLPVDRYEKRLNIEYLSNDIDFINSLSSLGLKKSDVKNSKDYQTFLNKPCKFMFIYRIESNELENPEYLLFQVWNSTIEGWEDCELYKVNDSVNKFYDKLVSRTIEIIENGANYIYETSNGSEWVLHGASDEVYKKVFRKEDLQKLLNDRDVEVRVI